TEPSMARRTPFFSAPPKRPPRPSPVRWFFWASLLWQSVRGDGCVWGGSPDELSHIAPFTREMCGALSKFDKFGYLNYGETSMNVSLTPELESLVNEKVQTGMYQTASEVVREALRLLKERDETKLRELRETIQVGIDQLERGEYTEYDPA